MIEVISSHLEMLILPWEQLCNRTKALGPGHPTHVQTSRVSKCGWQQSGPACCIGPTCGQLRGIRGSEPNGSARKYLTLGNLPAGLIGRNVEGESLGSKTYPKHDSPRAVPRWLGGGVEAIGARCSCIGRNKPGGECRLRSGTLRFN